MAVDTIVERRFWDEPAQTIAPDELRGVQTERLEETVKRAYDGSGFFRRRFGAAGVSPADVVPTWHL